MNSELIHTSLARGLDGGSGYTVAGRTGGMPMAMSDALVRLSGLPQSWIDSTNDEKILRALRRIQCAGKPLAVLSHIAPSGMDYTGRANRLSHHRVLDEDSMGASDPCALLDDPSLWMREWVGAARELSGGDLPQRVVRDDAPLATWRRVYGDAGWAASVLDLALNSGIGMWLVVPALGDKLRLCAEMMSLLPREQRWQFTFATRPIAPGAEASVKICFVDEREPELAKQPAQCAWIARVGSGSLSSKPSGEMAHRAREESGKDSVVAWNPPEQLALARDRSGAPSTRARKATGDASGQASASAPVVIEVRRMANQTPRGGVWKWFAALLAVAGAMVWLALRSGAPT